jgi:hypothetical protein
MPEVQADSYNKDLSYKLGEMSSNSSSFITTFVTSDKSLVFKIWASTF